MGGAGLALLLTAMQGGMPGLPRSFDASRVFEILVVAGGLLLLREGRSPARWPWIWGGLLGVGVLSAALSTHPGLGLKEVLLWTGLLLLVPRAAALRMGSLAGLGAFLVTVQVVWTVDLLVFWVQPHLLGAAFDPQIFDPFWFGFNFFGHPRFLNQFQSWMLPVASLLCLRLQAPRWIRGVCWGLLVVSWSQLWLSMGRGSMVGLTAGILTVAVLLGSEGRRFALLQGGLAAAGWALYLLLFRFLSREGVFQSVADRPFTTTGRTPAWERAWEMFLEAPVLGRGPQSFAWEGIRFGHPHSSPLQLLAEWGAVGTLVIAGALGMGAWAAVQLHRSRGLRMAQRGWFIALVCSSVAAATHALVSGVLVMPLSHLGGVVVLALWFRVAGVPRRRERRGVAGAVAGALVLLVALGLAFPDLILPGLGPAAMDLDSRAVQGFVRPRFWGDGL